MPRKAWYEIDENIILLSRCIREKNIFEFHDFEVRTLCQALKLNENKVRDGHLLFVGKIRMMYLAALNYFNLHRIEKTSFNYSMFILWKYSGHNKKHKKMQLESFTDINENVFISIAPKQIIQEADVCKCSITDKCKHENKCINRATLTECDANCPMKNECCNKRLQLNKFPSIEVFKLKNEQLGIRSATNIERGEIIGEYRGEVINYKQMKERQELYKNDECLYIFYFGDGLYIDAKYKGSITKFANHSCDPNSACYIVNSLGQRRLALIAKQNINIGEEICFNYGNFISTTKFVKCFCGTAKCKGRLPL